MTNDKQGNDPTEAKPAPLPDAIPTSDLTADLVAASKGDFAGEHRELLAQAAREIEQLRWGGGCTLSGVGRGDCSNSVGLPGKSIPGEHDGPDDTVDYTGRPNGWCQRCWDDHQISALRADVSPSEALFGFMAWLTCRKETSGPFGSSHEVPPAPELVGAFCESQGFADPRDDYTLRLKAYPQSGPKPVLAGDPWKATDVRSRDPQQIVIRDDGFGCPECGVPITLRADRPAQMPSVKVHGDVPKIELETTQIGELADSKLDSPLINEEEPKNPAPWPDPTSGMLNSPEFNAVWSVIKRWDVNVPEVYAGYCGATGNHVRAILDGLEQVQVRASRHLQFARSLVDWQAEDPRLWFMPDCITEGTLQAALRKLHQVVEGKTQADNIIAEQHGDGVRVGLFELLQRCRAVADVQGLPKLVARIADHLEDLSQPNYANPPSTAVERQVPDYIPKQVILHGEGVTFFPELHRQAEGHHGHGIEGWFGMLNLVARHKGGYSESQAITELQKVARQFADARPEDIDADVR